MSPHIATLVFALGIMALLLIDRDPKARTSFAVWIPIIWLSIGGSRVVSAWLDPTAQVSASVAYLEGNAVDRNVQTVLLTLATVVLIRRGKKSLQILQANAPILLFFLYCAVSMLWSDYPYVSFKRWVKAFGDLVMVLVVLTDPDRSAASKLPARVGFLLIPLSILLMKYHPELARGFDDITGEPEYTGVTTSKNSLGMICMLFGLGSVWRLLETYRSARDARRAARLIAHGAVIAMALWLFLWADSMTSLTCFVLTGSLLVATGFSALARRRWAVHLLVAVVLLGSSSVLFLGIGGGLLEHMGRDSSLTGRTEIWSRVLGMADHPWLGAGFESFWLGERLQKMLSIYRGINQAHNGYIEVFLNLGWAGVFLLAVVLLTGYRNILATLRTDPDAGRFRLAYFVVGVIVNYTEASFKMMSPVWVLFLLAITKVPETSIQKVPRSLATNAVRRVAETHGRMTGGRAGGSRTRDPSAGMAARRSS